MVSTPSLAYAGFTERQAAKLASFYLCWFIFSSLLSSSLDYVDPCGDNITAPLQLSPLYKRRLTTHAHALTVFVYAPAYFKATGGHEQLSREGIRLPFRIHKAPTGRQLLHGDEQPPYGEAEYAHIHAGWSAWLAPPADVLLHKPYP